MEVIKNLKEAVKLLDEIDEYNEQIHGENGYLAICDKKISFWEHYLEFNPLVVTQAYNINKEIKKLRMERRKYKNDAELIRVYKENIGKLQNQSNRSMLLANVNKTNNHQETRSYGYDAYTEDELYEILYGKRKEIKDINEINEN